MGINLELWQGKNILVTGHTGFKGSWLTLFLDHIGADVTGIGLEPSSKPNLFTEAGIQAIMQNHSIGDIRNFAFVEEVVRKQKPDFIFHLAAQSLVVESFRNPLETIATNVDGSANVVLAAMQNNHVRGILNVTTDKVYQNREQSKFFVESDALGGDDIYSASKACSEIITTALYHSFARNKFVSSARAGNVIGGGDWSEHRLVPDIIRSISSNSVLSLRSPRSTRPWQHVLDCIYGYILIAENALTQEDPGLPTSYNFGPDESLSVSRVLELFESELKLNIQVEYAKNMFPEKSSLHLDSTKSMLELGWLPRMNPVAAIKNTARWYNDYINGADPYLITKRDIEEYLESLP